MWWFDVGSDSVPLPQSSLHEQWMLVDKWWPKFRMSIQFQQHCGAGQLSCVAASGPRACHNMGQRSEWKNTGCHSKLEPYLAVIFRHCVSRDPNNQIRLRSPIYSPAMLKYGFDIDMNLAPTLRKKKSLCLHQLIRFLCATVAHDTESRSEITTYVEGKIVAQK